MLDTALEEDMLSVEVVRKEKLWLIATENNQPMLIKFFFEDELEVMVYSFY